MTLNRYQDLNSYLRRLYGCRVQKITVDAGFTCPNRDGSIAKGGCIYCNARGSGTGAHRRGVSITEQLENGKIFLSKRYKAEKFIAYFQAFTNTYAPLDILKKRYQEALAVEDVVGLSIGTRPDCIDDAILDILQEYAKTRLIWIEYGLQSANDKTLARIRRGHDYNAFVTAVRKTRNRGLHICAHVILGLPGETRQDMLETATAISRLGIDGVKIHLLYVIKGTPLEKWYLNGEYRCLEQSEYAEIVCDVLERLPRSMVIQRLTGDPHREELVAPMWALNKTETRSLIHEILEYRNSFQGKRVA